MGLVMSGIDPRFERNIRLFGTDGQRRLRSAHVAIVGAGGIGSHVIQQLALLGVGKIVVIDHEQISTTNKNRYIGATNEDPVPGTDKVNVARRLVQSIDPTTAVEAICDNLLSGSAFGAVRRSSHIFGCVDADGPRFVLNDIATAYGIPLIDSATDVSDGRFGGRIVTNWDGKGCLFCLDELDQNAVQIFLENSEERLNREAIYGIPNEALDQTGPSVVSVNGAVASLAVTEFMLGCTGMRAPVRFLNYDGLSARISPRKQDARPGCPYCSQWGIRDRADTNRYLQRQ
jgi:molybdopterin/thiamine biosynthesis adenylyltransferase